MEEEGGQMMEYQLVNAEGEALKSSRGYSGKGTATYTNGDIYQGDFVDGVRHGQGVYSYTTKVPEGADFQVTYSGAWEDNEKSGIGQQKYVGVGDYYGYWEAGKRHGEGVMTYENKDVYSGNWVCGQKEGKGTYYVFNGFFMTMRAGYVKPGRSLYYYVVEWDVKDLSWADFRGKVLGPTDPAQAPAESVRGGALADWENLGLAAAPNTGENCCHASASPFEGLAERMNWLNYKVEEDTWGKELLAAGVKKETIDAWTLDPQVKYGDKAAPTEKSIWDTLEDMDAKPCLDKCAEIDAWTP